MVERSTKTAPDANRDAALAGKLERQMCLANATRPDHREQPCLLAPQQPQPAQNIRLATNQRRRWQRKSRTISQIRHDVGRFGVGMQVGCAATISAARSCWGEVQRGDDQFQRLGARCEIDAAFEVTDGTNADARARGQRLLGETRECAIAPEQCAEWRR